MSNKTTTFRKKVFNIKILTFDDVSDFSCTVADMFNSEELNDVSIIAKYNEAKEIIRALICLGYDIASLDIHVAEFEKYYDEYIISISHDEKFEAPIIWCEKFKRDTGYISDCSSVTYILDNCNSKCLRKITTPIQYEVCIGSDELDNTDEFTKVVKNDIGSTVGFVKDWKTNTDGVKSTSTYSFFSDSEDLVTEIANKFGIEL